MQSNLAQERDLLILSGRPPMRDFVRLVKAKASIASEIDDSALTREWREANEIIRELEISERGAMDTPELLPLPDDVKAEADAVLNDPTLRRNFDVLPFNWALVELDRLISWQNHIDLDFSNSLESALPELPTMGDLVRFSAGQIREPPPLRVMARSGNNFVFSSRSSDMRILDTVTLRPESVHGYDVRGHALAVVGVFIGYSINTLTAAHMANRLVLLNGTHRAHAMRARGITHAPCIVRHVSRKDELDLLGPPRGAQSLEWFFTTERPPLLRDFFDPRLTKKLTVPRNTHVIELELKLEHSAIPMP